MNNKKIHILTAPKQSGKTTRLTAWAANLNNVFGILTPVINGKRFFVNVHTKEQFAMEAAEGETAILEVGRYQFSKAAFHKANGILLAAAEQPNAYIIVDEIGPLELKGLGFSAVVKQLLAAKEKSWELIFVVRDGLSDSVLDYFGLGAFEVVKMELGV